MRPGRREARADRDALLQAMGHDAEQSFNDSAGHHARGVGKVALRFAARRVKGSRHAEIAGAGAHEHVVEHDPFKQLEGRFGAAGLPVGERRVPRLGDDDVVDRVRIRHPVSRCDREPVAARHARALHRKVRQMRVGIAHQLCGLARVKRLGIDRMVDSPRRGGGMHEPQPEDVPVFGIPAFVG